MKAREIGAAVLNAKDDEEMTRLIHSMTDYQKEIMIKALGVDGKEGAGGDFSMCCD